MKVRFEYLCQVIVNESKFLKSRSAFLPLRFIKTRCELILLLLYK